MHYAKSKWLENETIYPQEFLKDLLVAKWRKKSQSRSERWRKQKRSSARGTTKITPPDTTITGTVVYRMSTTSMLVVLTPMITRRTSHCMSIGPVSNPAPKVICSGYILLASVLKRLGRVSG
jgi:hypothetical protein